MNEKTKFSIGFVAAMLAGAVAWGSLSTRVTVMEKKTDGLPEAVARVEAKVDIVLERTKDGRR